MRFVAAFQKTTVADLRVCTITRLGENKNNYPLPPHRYRESDIHLHGQYLNLNQRSFLITRTYTETVY